MLFPKPVRRVFLLILLIGTGWYGYNFVKPHARQDVMAFKRYSSALLEGESMRGKDLCATDYAFEPFQQRGNRDEAFDGEVRIVYHNIRSVSEAAGGEMVKLVVQQVIRYDPPADSTLWGRNKLINTQFVTLVAEKSNWKVESYRDNFFPES